MNWLLKHPIRVLAWHLFGIPTVILRDFDNEQTLAYVRTDMINGLSYAKRLEFDIYNVYLREDGSCRPWNGDQERCYVFSWHNAPWNKGAVKKKE
jgi:hypothetical protein